MSARLSWTWYRHVVAVLLVLSPVVACSSDNTSTFDQDAAAAAKGNALSSRATQRGVAWEFVGTQRTEAVSIDTMDRFDADREIILEDARPLRIDEELELLAVRVNFVEQTGGMPGNTCTRTWPPNGFGPSHAIAGLEVHEGQAPVITFYTRATEEGDYEMEGVEILYRENGTLFRQTSQTTRVELHVRDTDAGIREARRIHGGGVTDCSYDGTWVQPCDPQSYDACENHR